MEPVSFKSFDGREINGYLTKSNQASANKPMVVLVHGGPHGVRDYWGYDPEVQMLAAAGYNVLQVNYRGSKGYGSEFERAGYLQWGDGIQRDIIAGTEWAIKEGHAKSNNVCIMGASFGGYSALMAPMVSPDTYKCAIGVAGVYDLTIMKDIGDVTEKTFGDAYLDKVLGRDQAQLKAYSPVYQASKLKANVLLMHGSLDERAPIEHAEKLKAALNAANKPFEWVKIDDEANRELYFNRVLAFLGQNLQR
jgi:dipeptidyl aminopeptidase/acylaminoacyl peptidase